MAISNARSLEAVHRLRSRCDAVLVGIGTVLADDPLLTARVADPPRVPVRIVLDSNLRIGLDSQLVKTAKQRRCWSVASNALSERSEALKSNGAEVIRLRSDSEGMLSLEHLLDELGARKMSHLLVEPGVKLAQSFLRRNLVDRVWIFRSPMRVDAPDAPEAAHFDYPMTGRIPLDGDELREYLNPGSGAFYSLQKSVDLRLADGD